MKFSTEIVQEMEVLNMFPRESATLGIKIHHDADPGHIAAANRLFDKGLITLKDGGYLTDLGIEAADQCQALLSILNG
ncbi:MAG: TIGR02647 family protein [Pseudohongiellaceae bacterium]